MNKSDTIDSFLGETEFDTYLIYDDSVSNSSLYYLTGFEAPDPFTFVRKESQSTILTPQLEHPRAEKEADVDKVFSRSSYQKDKSKDEKEENQILAEFLNELGSSKIAVPEGFPFSLARELEDQGFTLEPVKDKAMEARKIKQPDEIRKLRNVQQPTEKAMEKAENIISEAVVRENKLYLNGEVLTSERLKNRIKMFLLEKSCDTPYSIIASSGKESAKPHSTGSGPIEANEPILIDLTPRKNRYFGDMSRTFVKGEASGELKNMKESVEKAMSRALDVLDQGAGLKACEVHNKVCDSLEEDGYETHRTGNMTKGFFHSTGHSIGLETHEPPKISLNEDKLRAGMIVTIEPGLYDPEIGGVRIEDMILIKENGYENFNSMHKSLEIS